MHKNAGTGANEAFRPHFLGSSETTRHWYVPGCPQGLLDLICESTDTWVRTVDMFLHLRCLCSRTESDLHREHDLLRANLSFRDVIKSIPGDHIQPSIEKFHRDVLQSSFYNQPRNPLQERGQRTPGVLVGGFDAVIDTVRGEDRDHYQSDGWLVVGRWFSQRGDSRGGRVDELMTLTSFLKSWIPLA